MSRVSVSGGNVIRTGPAELAKAFDLIAADKPIELRRRVGTARFFAGRQRHGHAGFVEADSSRLASLRPTTASAAPSAPRLRKIFARRLAPKKSMHRVAAG